MKWLGKIFRPFFVGFQIDEYHYQYPHWLQSSGNFPQWPKKDFSNRIFSFRSMTKWSKFYSIFTKFWLHGHTFTLSHVWESSKSFWKYSLFIWGLKCARIFSEKVYFPRNRCKSYLFRPVCKKYKICQKKNPFVFRALNQNSDSYKSCLCMLATFCMSQNVDLEP